MAECFMFSPNLINTLLAVVAVIQGSSKKSTKKVTEYLDSNKKVTKLQ